MGEVEYRAVWAEKPDRDSLTHHGIKGMKWGVRRTDAQLGHDIPSGGVGGGGHNLEDEWDTDEGDTDEILNELADSNDPFDKKRYELHSEMKDNYEIIREWGHDINNPRVSKADQIKAARKVREAKEANERLRAQDKRVKRAMISARKNRS